MTVDRPEIEPLGVLQMVDQTTWGGDDDMGLFAQANTLRDHVHSTWKRAYRVYFFLSLLTDAMIRQHAMI